MNRVIGVWFMLQVRLVILRLMNGVLFTCLVRLFRVCLVKLNVNPVHGPEGDRW